MAPLSVAEALAGSSQASAPTPAELVAVEAAHGRILADGAWSPA